MRIINIKKECRTGTVTRDDGQIIHDLLNEIWDEEDRIVLNFKGLIVASVSFMDEAFGKLAFDHTKDELKSKLKFRNMDYGDRALLNDIFISRFKQAILSKKPKTKKTPPRRRKS